MRTFKPILNFHYFFNFSYELIMNFISSFYMHNKENVKQSITFVPYWHNTKMLKKRNILRNGEMLHENEYTYRQHLVHRG